jgi:ankyrin repeat protein
LEELGDLLLLNQSLGAEISYGGKVIRAKSCGWIDQCGIVGLFTGAINGGELMQARQLVLVSIGVRLGILLLCFTLFYMHKAFGQQYFNPTLSVSAQLRAVSKTPNLDVRNDFGLTGLMFSAINGELELAKALVQQGASLNLIDSKEKNTALHFAINSMRSSISQQVGTYLIDMYANTRLKNKYGQTPLHLTISTDVDGDWVAMVERLIKNGADINAQTNQGDTILHLAVNMKKISWAKNLLERYGGLLNLNIKNAKGWTPYQYAIELGYGDFAREVFKTPIKKITKAAARDVNGLTGLMLAIMRGDQGVVETMVKDSAVLNELSDDPYKNSALHIAVLFESVPNIALLTKAGVSKTIKNSNGEIPLHYLVRMMRPKQRMSAANLLLAGAPETINIQNKRGETLLHYVVRYNLPQLLASLIKRYKKYMDITIKNKALQSPLQLANALRRGKMATMLAKLK